MHRVSTHTQCDFANTQRDFAGRDAMHRVSTITQIDTRDDTRESIHPNRLIVICPKIKKDEAETSSNPKFKISILKLKIISICFDQLVGDALPCGNGVDWGIIFRESFQRDQ